MTDFHVRNARGVLLRTFDTPDLALRFVETATHTHGDLTVSKVRVVETREVVARSHLNRDGSVQISHLGHAIRFRSVR